MTKTQKQFAYAVQQADDALVLSQRLAEWCGCAPFLEEDIALANVALDYIGRARLLYGYAAELEGKGRTEDDLAFFRDSDEFSNLLICELPRGDFAFTMARQFFLDVYSMEFLSRQETLEDRRLAAIAGKAIKESRYHLRRSREWMLRLGDGTEQSRQRLQDALDQLWAYVGELFTMEALELELAADRLAVDRAALQPCWQKQIEELLEKLSLPLPQGSQTRCGGRRGQHTEHLGPMLKDLQRLQREHPGLQW